MLVLVPVPVLEEEKVPVLGAVSMLEKEVLVLEEVLGVGAGHNSSRPEITERSAFFISAIR